MKSKHIFFTVSLVIVLVGGLFYFKNQNFLLPSSEMAQKKMLRVGEATYQVEVADTELLQERGLSGRESLDEDEGMLFPFLVLSTYGFWMKDMNFPIDIVWIANGKVVGFAENVSPDDREDRPVYYPPEPVDMVLEIKAGEVAKKNILVGQEVVLLPINS